LFEEVTRLDPGVHWDWVELGRLYQSAGRLSDALAATKHAADNAKTERDQAVALGELGDVQVKRGDLAGALVSFRKALAITETLAVLDPNNTDWQSDLSVSYFKVGGVQMKQGDLAGALASFRKYLGIMETLAAVGSERRRSTA
jgi:tetratricopeptide (TPR) repeat protein